MEHLSGLASFNPLNIVVNNAAPPITRTDRQIEWTDKEWFAAIDVKTVGALRLIRETIHLIPHDGTGRIINVAGGFGIAVWSPALLHGINNAALLHMTGFLAADLAANKVTVNAIVPGLVGTEFRQIWAKELGERQGKSTEEFVGEFCKSKGILLERSIYRNANSSLPARSRCLSTSQPYRAPLLPSQELETPCNKVRPPRQKLSRRTRSRRRRHPGDLNEFLYLGVSILYSLGGDDHGELADVAKS